jgi:hypothetical protein
MKAVGRAHGSHYLRQRRTRPHFKCTCSPRAHWQASEAFKTNEVCPFRALGRPEVRIFITVVWNATSLFFSDHLASTKKDRTA